MAISGKTRVCGIIGDPIEHSVSPAMQNVAFRELGLDFVYVPFRVSRNSLSDAIRGMRAMDFAGLNVTIPHKVAIMHMLDEIDPLAINIGAINTIVNRGGYLRGYNTDAAGFRRSLMGIDLKGIKAVIIGAGGAARSAAFVLSSEKADITILNRHSEKAQALANQIESSAGRRPVALGLTEENLSSALKHAALLVNTTSVGMAPLRNETPIPASLLRAGLVVFDIIYNPLETRLLADAKERGAKGISGTEMLVQQGAEAFELWTGRKAPIEVMREAAVKELR